DQEGRPARPESEGLEQAAAGGPLVRLGTARLAVAGMTGSELAVMLTLLFWVVQVVDDLPDSFLQDVAGNLTAPSSVGGFLAAGAALLVVWFGLAAAASILKNHGFTLARDGDDLRVSRGLLDRREGSMPFHRLQAVRVQATIVRRGLRLAEVVLQSGGGATASRAGLSRIDVPILDTGAVAPLLGALLPVAPPGEDAYVPAPPAARRRAIVRRVVPATVVAAGLTAFDVRALPVGALLVAGAGVAGELAYRGLAHAWQRELLLTRSGGLARETVVAPAAKAQSTRLRTTPFQRRAGLATLHVDVAGKGPTPTVKDGDADRLRRLQRDVLTATSARQDERRLRREPAPGASATSRHA
ncbi:MAG TPA: PH domain-containing protein, partial [Acidimicrobiales bacterium]|nr:PH domain-containing protein [Acidimicrobiales bacterium]